MSNKITNIEILVAKYHSHLLQFISLPSIASYNILYMIFKVTGIDHH